METSASVSDPQLSPSFGQQPQARKKVPPRGRVTLRGEVSEASSSEASSSWQLTQRAGRVSAGFCQTGRDWNPLLVLGA